MPDIDAKILISGRTDRRRKSMRLSTSTNIFFNRPGNRKADIEDSIRLCSMAGYKVMDMNFYDCTTFRLPFVSERWKSWVQGIKTLADECGIEFSQAHANFYNFCDSNVKDKEFLDQMIMRSMECAGILGVKWIVIHAGTDFDSPYLVRDSKKKNIEYFKPVIECAARNHVGLAIENLWDYNIAPLRRYTTTAEELFDLVDTLHDEYGNVGICWDFEHANIMKQAQKPALQMIGKHLKATHVSDNSGIHNDHILPFYGCTNWYEIMQILKGIGYQGDFTYEIHRYTAQLPDALVIPALKYSIEVGNYLLSMADNISMEDLI